MVLQLLVLFIFSGCATKYVVPGNRFITPETQGGMFNTQMEYQQTEGTQVTINTDNGSVQDGVYYSPLRRSGFQFSSSLLEQIDFLWSHTGSSNSMLGVKVQLLGASRSSKGSGHKLGLAFLGGNNSHETDDKAVEFTLSGTEYLLLYGYRMNEFLLPYLGLSYATYDFSGSIKSSNPALNGQRPEYGTTSRSLFLGSEFSIGVLTSKLETSYQQLFTQKTSAEDRLTFGYSVGFSF